MQKIVLSLLLSAGILAFVHPTAFQSYISFKGKKQGQLKGSNTSKGREKDGWFNVVAFDMGSERPVDAAQSAAAGKRQHQPIVITREMDSASPLLFQAQSSKEVFESVIIETIDDKNKPTKTVTLSDAVLVSVHKDGTKETLTINYDKLVMTN